MQILWLKRDLRLQDNAALRLGIGRASSHGAVLPVYLHEPALIICPDHAAQHTGFLRETLDELGHDIAARGGTLLELAGDAVDVFETLWQKTRFSTLLAHQETGNQASFARDIQVRAWCRTRGVTLFELEQNAVRRGHAFREQGFAFKAHLESACATAPWRPDDVLPFAIPPVPSCDPATRGVGVGADKAGRLRGGRSHAERYLADFVDTEKLMAYPSAISSPNTAPTGCSRLSPYLAFGVLSDREIFHSLNSMVDAASTQMGASESKSLQSSVQFYAERLYWRSAYLQKFEQHIETESAHDLAAFGTVREGEIDLEWLTAWKEGCTGYPMVDAAMTMLADTGWLNMRLRGTVVSFAVNELWLPWQEVGIHLAREFLDYEPGIHWNQLQIHAGTSRLGGPLTYNPVKQALDHDAKGLFVKQWLPALANVPLSHITEPWRMTAAMQEAIGCRIGVDYPTPIVTHQAANDAARLRVAALREGKPVPNTVYWRRRAQERMQEKQSGLF